MAEFPHKLLASRLLDEVPVRSFGVFWAQGRAKIKATFGYILKVAITLKIHSEGTLAPFQSNELHLI